MMTDEMLSRRQYFAENVVSLMLLRNEFEIVTQPRDSLGLADLMARKQADSGAQEFLVDVSWTPSRDGAARLVAQLESEKRHVGGGRGAGLLRLFHAIVIGLGDKLVVSSGLLDKLMFNEKEIAVTTIDDCLPVSVAP